MAPSSFKSTPSPLNPSQLYMHLQVEDADDVRNRTTPKHQRTPLHHQRPDQNDDVSVSWIKCRPHARERTSVAPLEFLNKTTSSIASPNKIFKSIVSTLTRKSPRPSETPPPATEEHWKIAVAELSHKLVQATWKRDEALLEASRLKYSMAELEKKLTSLELYCHTLMSGLEERAPKTSPFRNNNHNYHDIVIERFLVSVSEARSSVRHLSRTLTVQLRHTGAKVHERISALLQPYDLKIYPLSKNTRIVLFYLEALLNKTLFEDFESVGSRTSPLLNPVHRCEANYASYDVVHSLTWEEVLEKGTKHFSKEFSGFCDRKMSQIVSMLGWTRAWPEPLLQAFFAAAKHVWLVHVLATSVHPGLPILRVEKGMRFDPDYMEDMGGDKDRTLVASAVRIMVAPGFYVYDSVVKCKVLCTYHDNGQSNGRGDNLI